MKKISLFFENVKILVEGVCTLQSQMARMLYILGELVDRIKMIEKEE